MPRNLHRNMHKVSEKEPMADTKYLIKRHHVYYLNYPVPKDFQKALGRKFISKTTGTGDLKAARIFRNQFIAKLEAQAISTDDSDLALYRDSLRLFSEADHETLFVEGESLAEKVEKGDEDAKVKLGALREVQGLSLPNWKKPTVTLKQAQQRHKLGNESRYKRAVELYLASAGVVDVELMSVGRKSVKGFIASLDCARTTKQGYVSCLSELWRLMEDDEEVTGNNPFKGHKIEGEESTYIPFESKELVEVISKLPSDDDRLFAELGYYTGARRGELWGLRPEDIEVIEGQVIIRIRPYSGRRLKNKSSERSLPLHPAIAQRILRHSEGRPSGKSIWTHRADDDAFGKAFGRVKSKVVSDRAKTFHSLRASMATMLEHGGVPEVVAASMLGHERTVSMSYGLYSTGASLEQLVDAMRAVPVLIE